MAQLAQLAPNWPRTECVQLKAEGGGGCGNRRGHGSWGGVSVPASALLARDDVIDH